MPTYFSGNRVIRVSHTICEVIRGHWQENAKPFSETTWLFSKYVNHEPWSSLYQDLLKCKVAVIMTLSPQMSPMSALTEKFFLTS